MAIELQEFGLSLEEVEQFRRQGFLGPFTAFTSQAMDRIRQTVCDRVLPTPTPHSSYPSRLRHLDSRSVFEMCSAPAIIGRMASVYGPDLVLWASNIFDKPPARKGHLEEYPWHQDLYNWHLEPMLNISAWLAISPATVKNGCVEVIPGSHKQFVPPLRDTDERHSFRFAGSAADPAYFDESQRVPMVLEPGQFFLFNERTLHHSNPNRTRQRRLGLAIRVTTPITKNSEPWPCQLLTGEDRMGFNQYVSPPQDEPDVGWLASLPESGDFTFDRPVPGLGWHFPETDGEHRFAWIGPENDAWLDLRTCGDAERLLRCEVLHSVSPKSLQGVQVLVNGYRVKIQQRTDGRATVLEGRVPRGKVASGAERARVTIHVPQLVRPCDVNPASQDNRHLGLGISRVALLPAA